MCEANAFLVKDGIKLHPLAVRNIEHIMVRQEPLVPNHPQSGVLYYQRSLSLFRLLRGSIDRNYELPCRYPRREGGP